MARVFVSYRQLDSADICERITEHLERRYGKRHIFRDVSTLLAGSNFPNAIRQALAESRVVLALIGPRWLDIRDEHGQRRLDEATDFVRLEVATALREGKMVIPVLVKGARMPGAAELPPDLGPLTLRRPFVVRGDPYFRGDMEPVYRTIGREAAWRPAHLGVFLSGLLITVCFALTLGLGFAKLAAAQIPCVVVLFCAAVAAIALSLVRVLTTRRWGWLAVPVAIAASLAGAIDLQYVNDIVFFICLPALCALAITFGAIGPARIRSNIRPDNRTAWRTTARWVLGMSALALLGNLLAYGLALPRIAGTFQIAVIALAGGILLPFVPWVVALRQCLRTGQRRWLLALLLAVLCISLPVIVILAGVTAKSFAGLVLVILPELLGLGILLGFGWWGLRQGTVDVPAAEQIPAPALPIG